MYDADGKRGMKEGRGGRDFEEEKVLGVVERPGSSALDHFLRENLTESGESFYSVGRLRDDVV